MKNACLKGMAARTRLNLAAVKAMSVPPARDMMDIGDKLIAIFYKISPKSQHNLET